MNKISALGRKADVKLVNNDLEGAKAMLEEMKVMMTPIQNPRKMEGYEFFLGQISYRQKDYANAIKHFEMSDKLNVYTKYWLAKAYEVAGQKDRAMTLYKDVANYNFNGIDYARIRNEVRQKM